MLAIYNELRHTNAFSFYAIVGVENDREVYTFNATYAELVDCFKPVPYDPNSDLLLQRETQVSRINSICDYSQVSYAAFPACGAILEQFSVETTVVPNVVRLTIPASAFRYLFDGQGRRGGIEKLLKLKPKFSNNSITIKGYKTEGVERDNQLFSDFNAAGLKPNQSIVQSMDSRTLINTFTKGILKDSAMTTINKRIDYTKASVTQSKSPKLWSLNQFNTVVQIILGVTAKSAEKLLKDEEKQAYWRGYIIKFFNQMAKTEAIQRALSSDEGAQQAKESTIIGTAVWLKGMAVAGKSIALHLLENTEPGTAADWSFMEKLSELDLSRDNDEWIGRCMDFRGGMQDKSFNHKAMAAFTLRTLGIPLPEELEVAEDDVLVAKSEQRKARRAAQQAQQQAEAQEEMLLEEVA